MFIASCVIVTASLIILGVFFLIIFNFDENIKALDEKPQIQIYCRYDMTDGELNALESEILAGRGIKEFYRVSREEAYVRAKELLGEDSDILDGIEPDFLPVSFILKLDESGMINDFVHWLDDNPNIEKISYPQRTIDLISRVSNWAKAFGLAIAAMPIMFAVFIVSNAIKMALFERRGEISIMRYIGATEQIVRWPFIVEGMITGIVGATVAFLATGFGYMAIESNVNMEMAGLTDGLFMLVKIDDVSTFLLLAYVLIGVGVGAVGSARSIRKYLKV